MLPTIRKYAPSAKIVVLDYLFVEAITVDRVVRRPLCGRQAREWWGPPHDHGASQEPADHACPAGHTSMPLPTGTASLVAETVDDQTAGPRSPVPDLATAADLT